MSQMSEQFLFGRKCKISRGVRVFGHLGITGLLVVQEKTEKVEGRRTDLRV